MRKLYKKSYGLSCHCGTCFCVGKVMFYVKQSIVHIDRADRYPTLRRSLPRSEARPALLSVLLLDFFKYIFKHVRNF